MADFQLDHTQVVKELEQEVLFIIEIIVQARSLHTFPKPAVS
jgi:hypothetical protein